MILKLLLALALMLGLFLLWKKWQRASQIRHIDAFPYQDRLDRRLAARRPELSLEQRTQVFAGLHDYFSICHAAGKRMVAMPSQAVDDAWHEFILFTRHYDRFCQQAFGRFLHHTPAEAMRSPTQASDGLKLAWQLACRREDINPKRPERLPRIFALDALLGIAGGFVYQLDCLAASGGTAGDGYCASHIGCSSGSGCSGDTGASDSSGDGGSSGCGGGCGGGGGD